MAKKLKVLIVASEGSPFSKSGGLGDVIGSLPKELQAQDVDVRIVLPKYKSIKDELITDVKNMANLYVSLGYNKYGCSVFANDNNGVITYLIENHDFFSRDGFYGYDDDYLRFAFFTKASLEMLHLVDFKPDVINFNDWQTGLGPIYLRDQLSQFTFYKDIKSVFTIHNIQYQGIFSPYILGQVGLNRGYANYDKLEFYGAINFMKGGILYADKVTTVSKTYAQEIQTWQYGYKLNEILKEQSHKVCGILNGIDKSLNDPKTDNLIFKNFDIDSLDIKRENKKSLQEELGLDIREDVPVISVISRLVDQKGIELIAYAMNELMGLDIQLIILGTGDKHYEDMFKYYAYHNKGKVSANIFFNEKLAHKIYASSDIFLMPSLFEPCGLSQIFSMCYGTIPVVRNTGGLSDTISQYDYETKQGTGFKFNDYDKNGLMWCLNEAIEAYHSDDFINIIKNAMNNDFSWEKSAKEYIELYNELKELKY